MRISTKTYRAADVALGSAVLLWAVTGVVAAGNWSGHVSGGAFAVGALAFAVTTTALALNSRCAATGLTRTVEQAPRDQYYHGYGDASKDVLG